MKTIRGVYFGRVITSKELSKIWAENKAVVESKKTENKNGN